MNDTTAAKTETHESEHDKLKHALASSLRQFVEGLPPEYSGSVEVEERILDGRRRIDVTLHRDFFMRSHSWAFEVKATLGDAIGVHGQLSDYAHAGYTPVFVKKRQLHPTGTLPDGDMNAAKKYAEVAEAEINNNSVRFEPITGFNSDVCLSELQKFWRGREFLFDIHKKRQNAVLEELADGRANPYLIREETGLDKGDTNTVLNRLARAGYVEQVTRGLYEITKSGKRRVRNDG